jgi:hypothetical protein
LRRRRRDDYELLVRREIFVAEAELAQMRRLSAAEASQALREHAAAGGVSVHAAALAVMATPETSAIA